MNSFARPTTDSSNLPPLEAAAVPIEVRDANASFWIRKLAKSDDGAAELVEAAADISLVELSAVVVLARFGSGAGGEAGCCLFLSLASCSVMVSLSSSIVVCSVSIFFFRVETVFTSVPRPRPRPASFSARRKLR